MKKIVYSILTVIIFINSCNSPIEPEPQPGRRDYVWEVDTLKLPYGEFTSIRGIWGASPTDIWACGGGSSNKYRLWHYNGSTWSNVETNLPLIDARKIFGFNSKSIWLVTAVGYILFYDGTKWISQGNYSTDKEWLVLQGIWGRNDTDLYAFGFLDKRDLSGYYGCILKYSNGSWRFLDIEKLNLNFVTMGYDEESKKYFLGAFRSEDGMQFIYELDGNKLIEIHKGKEELKIFSLGKRTYFMINKKIFRYDNGNLKIWQDFAAYSIYAGVLQGRNEKDIFTINWGGIGHFNGSNIVMLYLTDSWLLSSILFNKELFVASKNFQTGINLIINGKLKN
jgi:hypothetical protein